MQITSCCGDSELLCVEPAKCVMSRLIYNDIIFLTRHNRKQKCETTLISVLSFECLYNWFQVLFSVKKSTWTTIWPRFLFLNTLFHADTCYLCMSQFSDSL